MASLSVTGASGAKLDLADNDLIIDYVSASPISSIRAEIARAYNLNGTKWTGAGITCSTAQASSTTYSLGIGEASTVFGSSGGTFSGQSVDGSTVLVKFTYAGDANLDGMVNILDLSIYAGHANMSATWTEGDFNYDGTANIVDLGILSSNWQAGVTNPLSMAFEVAAAMLGLPNVSVPEPSVIGVVVIGVAMAVSRRRQRARIE